MVIFVGVLAFAFGVWREIYWLMGWGSIFGALITLIEWLFYSFSTGSGGSARDRFPTLNDIQIISFPIVVGLIMYSPFLLAVERSFAIEIITNGILMVMVGTASYRIQYAIWGPPYSLPDAKVP